MAIKNAVIQHCYLEEEYSVNKNARILNQTSCLKLTWLNNKEKPWDVYEQI